MATFVVSKVVGVKAWRKRPKAHQVTDAQPSLTDDIGRREKRYLIQMGIRTLCLILAVVVPAPWPIRGLFIAGAIFLPYIAVVGANGGREPGNVPDLHGPEMTEANQTEIPRHRREIGS
jgi:hypothetical protein